MNKKDVNVFNENQEVDKEKLMDSSSIREGELADKENIEAESKTNLDDDAFDNVGGEAQKSQLQELAMVNSRSSDNVVGISVNSEEHNYEQQNLEQNDAKLDPPTNQRGEGAIFPTILEMER